MKGPISRGPGGPGRGLPESELRVLLDGMSQVLEQVFDRLDDQTRALHKLTAAVEALQEKSGDADPELVARVTAREVRQSFLPTMAKLVDVTEELTGTKAVLRERLRAIDQKEARQGRWRFQPLAVVVGIPLALVTALALTVPRAAAQFAPTCEATGGTWYQATERYTAACMYPKEERG